MKKGNIFLTGLLLICFLLGNADFSFSADAISDSALGKGKISCYCFNDENGNGIKDAGEDGVAGITVSLKRLYFMLFPREVGTAETGADGTYEFTNLGLGFYRVEVTDTDEAECKTKNPVLTFIGFFRKEKVINFGFSVSEVPAPTASISANPTVINKGESSTLSWTTENADTVTIDQGIGTVAASGYLQVTPQQTTTYTITADGDGGTATDSVTITVNTPQTTTSTTPTTTSMPPTTSTSTSTTTTSVPNVIPPDPASVAPPLDPTVATDMYTATKFLYSGDNLIQYGVAPGTIDPKRVAVVRGKVLDKNNDPLPGVIITILSHPEFGVTLSREDGMFDMAVNGGGLLTINYAKASYLTAQRQLNVPWHDYVMAPDVCLVPLDTQVTQINLNAPVPIQVAQASVVTDNDGTRQATLMVTQGTAAEMVLPDGSTQPLTTLSIRATEYTTGPNGPKTMPGELPPTSGYTYCIEVSADEALTAGAASVNLSQPVYTYVENFIGFPVGSAVPAGYYNRQTGQWVPSENGRVIRLISINGGMADIDTDGDGNADSGLGITTAERQQLANIYPIVPKQLWRIPITHFTPWDFNWPYGPPQGATDPRQPDPLCGLPEDEACEGSGSIVECQNQVLGQRIPVVGTPFTLNYRSDRTPGRIASRTLKIPISGSSLPPGIQQIVLEVRVAGRVFPFSFAPAPNLSHTFIWDGKDVYGRTVQGRQMVLAKIGYVYQSVYYPVNADFEQSFSRTSPTAQGVMSRETSLITLYQNWTGYIGSQDFLGQGLGGWSLDVHHVYDPSSRTIYFGDGSRKSAA